MVAMLAMVAMVAMVMVAMVGRVMVWHHVHGHGMEVVADLSHASFGVMRQVDEDFTSL